MRHERWEDLIIEVLDGRAAPPVRERLQRHLAECSECEGAYREYRRIFAGLRDGGAHDIPAGFWDSLAGDLERRLAGEPGPPAGHAAAPEPASRGSRSPGEGGWKGVGAGLAAACVAVLILIALYLQLPRTAAEPQAFTTSPRARALPPGTEGELLTAEDLARAEAAEDAIPPEASGAGVAPGLVTRANALRAPAAEVPEVAESPELRDPLLMLADPDAALRGLTVNEAEALLSFLESGR